MVAVALVASWHRSRMPSYQNYVRRGQLADAFTSLADMRVKMEQYYQDNKFYGTAANTTTCATLPGYAAFPVSTKYFTLSCAAGAAPSQTFTLTATGIGGLTTGYEYTLNQSVPRARPSSPATRRRPLLDDQGQRLRQLMEPMMNSAASRSSRLSSRSRSRPFCWQR